MRRLQLFVAICSWLVLASCGADGAEPSDVGSAGEQAGLGEPAELNVAETDRIEVRHGGSAWPGPVNPEAWLQADTVAELTHPEQVRHLVEALEAARFIDVGSVTYDLVPPDYQVGFFRGDELLERLGYYERVGVWGEHRTPGRWVTDRWDLLAVTEETLWSSGELTWRSPASVSLTSG